MALYGAACSLAIARRRSLSDDALQMEARANTATNAKAGLGSFFPLLPQTSLPATEEEAFPSVESSQAHK
jgi:hypothetical protein